jgi:hypothetical protein
MLKRRGEENRQNRTRVLLRDVLVDEKTSPRRRALRKEEEEDSMMREGGERQNDVV